MNEVITIFQDYKQNIIQYKDHFPIIEEFKQLIGEQNLILQTDGSIQVKNYVGFLQKGKTKLQVLPKIYSGNKIENDEIEDSMSFLFRLLAWSDYFSFKDLDELDISIRKKDAFEIFIRIFIQKFLKEFNRSPHYEYITQIENQQIIKGKILFTETIKRNSHSWHKHIVEFDEFSIDNKLNQLFKFVILELIKSTDDGQNKMMLRQGIVLLEEVSTLNISAEFFNCIQFNRQNQRFKSLFNFAKLFFFNNQPGLSTGKEKTFSFLIPLNLLFENAVKVFLQNIGSKNENLKIDYHKHISFGNEDGENRFILEPDFLLKERGIDNKWKTIAVLDTKFKYPFNEQGKAAIKDSDLYQLTTYASAFKTDLIFVIYPLFRNSLSTKSCIATYSLKTHFINTKLVLLQVDITEECKEKIQDDLNNSILSLLKPKISPPQVLIEVVSHTTIHQLTD